MMVGQINTIFHDEFNVKYYERVEPDPLEEDEEIDL